MTEGSSVGRVAAVTGEPAGPFHTSALVLAERCVAAAVPRAAGLDARCDPCPLLQVQCYAVQLQGADAAQKAFLP